MGTRLSGTWWFIIFAVLLIAAVPICLRLWQMLFR